MNWEKLGRIYTPQHKNDLLVSHATNATALLLSEDTFRIFYNSRDAQNRSSVSYFDFDLGNEILTYDHPEAIVSYGAPDTYYSHGVSLGSLFQEDGKTRLFFMGWQIRGKDHWRGDIGSIELQNKGESSVVGAAPFLECDRKIDLISLSYPWIIKEEDKYRMWYGSTLDWTSENGEMLHVIQYAESNDGVNWNRLGSAFPHQIGVAQAFSRPTIHIDQDGLYHMWFSYRSGNGTSYRIGYATSADGIDWSLKLGNPGIDVSSTGWDSEMICYPFVFEHKDQVYMLYNGNRYGATGIGLAKWERDA